MENKNKSSERKPHINLNALEELRKKFNTYPKIIPLLEKTLQKKEEILRNYVQINGDCLHGAIFAKGPTYWFGIWTIDKYGKENPLIRICDYIGIGDMVREGRPKLEIVGEVRE